MSTETMAPDSLELKPGMDGFFDDWSSDQLAFKGVPWGKAMMWIFLVSDTFIFGCFLASYMTVRMSTLDPWPSASEVFALSFGGAPYTAHFDCDHDICTDHLERHHGVGGQLWLSEE